MSAAKNARVGGLVHDVARLRSTAINRTLRTLGSTRAQWALLVHIAQSRCVKTQSELARELGLGNVTIGGLVDRLIEKGCVRRRSVESDRRVKQVVITKKGLYTWKTAERRLATREQKMASGIALSELMCAEGVLFSMRRRLFDLCRSQGIAEMAQGDITVTSRTMHSTGEPSAFTRSETHKKVLKKGRGASDMRL